MLREIKGTQRLPRLLAFKLTGTGTAALNEGGSDATLTDNGTGDYTLTFTRAFLRAPVVIATPVASAGDVICSLHTISTSAVRIVAFDGTDGTTAKDAVLHIMVLGWDTADTY